MTAVRSVAGSATFDEAQRPADRALVAVQGGRGGPARDIQVGPAVAVAIGDRDPAADRIGEVAGVRVVHPGPGGLVDEARRAESRRARRPQPADRETADR